MPDRYSDPRHELRNKLKLDGKVERRNKMRPYAMKHQCRDCGHYPDEHDPDCICHCHP